MRRVRGPSRDGPVDRDAERGAGLAAVLLMPLARPERDGGTALTAAVTSGAVNIPIPKPTPSSAGSSRT